MERKRRRKRAPQPAASRRQKDHATGAGRSEDAPLDDVRVPVDAWQARAWACVVIVACLVTALASTWPLALHLASAIPLGTESAPTVPVFDVWTLGWGADRFAHGFSGLWNAPIFHPTLGTFAFSEPMLLQTVLAAPLFWLGAPPALAHNVVLLAVLASNGVAGYRVARALGVTRLPALAAGISMVTLPFFGKVEGELPILAVAGTLVALDGVVRFGEDGRTRHVVEVAAGIVLQFLTCQQLTLFSVLFVAGAAVLAAKERNFARIAVARLGGAFALAGLLLYLTGRVPLRVHEEQGFRRAADLVQSLSATPLDFLSRPSTSPLPVPPRENPDAYTEGLFPGFLVLALAAFGVVARTADARRRRWRWYAVGATIAGFALALGLNFSIGDMKPFDLLRHLTGFAEVRSVFRCAVFVQIHLVLLAAFGLSALFGRVRRSPAHRAAAVLGVGILASAENWCVPAPLLSLPSPRTEWSDYLARQPPGTVVAHVPFPKTGAVEDLAPEAWRMFAQLHHRQPIVNGYSSNFPAVYREFMFAAGAEFPKRMLACALLRVFEADLLVVDQDWLSSHGAPFAAEVAPMLTPTYSDATVSIYRFLPPNADCPPMRIDIGAK